jgi:CP family cyanate transporter-like MFS transporter
MTHILSTRPLAHYRLRVIETEAATAEVPPARACPALSFAATVAAIVLVAIDLRPGIVSVGPLLPHILQEFGMSNAEASLLTAIPAMLMGLLAFPTPWLAHRFGRDRVILTALIVLMLATILRAFSSSVVMLLASTVGVGAGDCGRRCFNPRLRKEELSEARSGGCRSCRSGYFQLPFST